MEIPKCLTESCSRQCAAGIAEIDRGYCHPCAKKRVESRNRAKAQKYIDEAVTAEREAIIQAIEANRPHSGKHCGCGECTGAGEAIDIIRIRGEG